VQYDFARLVVHASEDGGRTWSNAAVIAAPVPNTASECALVDGAAYYDATYDSWHYLSQCLDRNHAWMLCHFHRNGSNPMGPFVANPANPVRLALPARAWH
jgi:hypothetical protein